MIPNADRALVVYARLAAVSQHMRQFSGRDRLLVLTAAAACEAGYPHIAEDCRRLVMTNNPQHLFGRFASATDAMRSEDFRSLVAQNQRLCSFERAEHLLENLDEDVTAALFATNPADNAEPASDDIEAAAGMIAALFQ